MTDNDPVCWNCARARKVMLTEANDVVAIYFLPCGRWVETGNCSWWQQ